MAGVARNMACTLLTNYPTMLRDTGGTANTRHTWGKRNRGGKSEEPSLTKKVGGTDKKKKLALSERPPKQYSLQNLTSMEIHLITSLRRGTKRHTTRWPQS